MSDPIRYEGKLEPGEIAGLIEAIQKSDLRSFITLNIAFPHATTQAKVTINVMNEAANVFAFAIKDGSFHAWKAFTLCTGA